MKYKTLIPAYSRDYKTAKAVKADFDADKDFLISDAFDAYDGKPVNLSQLLTESPITVNIRFARQTKIVQVKL